MLNAIAPPKGKNIRKEGPSRWNCQTTSDRQMLQRVTQAHVIFFRDDVCTGDVEGCICPWLEPTSTSVTRPPHSQPVYKVPLSPEQSWSVSLQQPPEQIKLFIINVGWGGLPRTYFCGAGESRSDFFFKDGGRGDSPDLQSLCQGSWGQAEVLIPNYSLKAKSHCPNLAVFRSQQSSHGSFSSMSSELTKISS